jgi:hypothetical protein
MAHIPLNNETDYALTDDMRKDIIRDAQEYFGEHVRSIRVQDGIERHAFNARIGEVRYAFSPQGETRRRTRKTSSNWTTRLRMWTMTRKKISWTMMTMMINGGMWGHEARTSNHSVLPQSPLRGRRPSRRGRGVSAIRPEKAEKGAYGIP